MQQQQDIGYGIRIGSAVFASCPGRSGSPSWPASAGHMDGRRLGGGAPLLT